MSSNKTINLESFDSLLSPSNNNYIKNLCYNYISPLDNNSKNESLIHLQLLSIKDFEQFSPKIKSFKNESELLNKSEELFSFNNNIEINEKNNNDHKVGNNYFKIFSIQKRGRKVLGKKRSEHIHGAGDYDNVGTKILTNFISFLISLANDAIFCILGKNKDNDNNNKITDNANDYYIDYKKKENQFLNIDFCIKRNLKYKYNLTSNNIFTALTYRDILKFKVSSKYKRYQEGHNKKIFIKVCEKSSILEEFFSQTFIKLFKDYFYNNLQQLNELYFLNKKIVLTNRTKSRSFFTLLQKNHRYKKTFIDIVKKDYFIDDIDENSKNNKSSINDGPNINLTYKIFITNKIFLK